MMQVSTFVTSCILALASAPVAASDDALRDAELYYELPARETIYATPLAAAQALTGGYPDTREVNPTLKVQIDRHPAFDGRVIVIASLEPLLDDSVRAEEWRAVLAPVEGGWKMEKLGARFICYRGSNTETWTNRLCP